MLDSNSTSAPDAFLTHLNASVNVTRFPNQAYFDRILPSVIALLILFVLSALGKAFKLSDLL